MVIEICNFNPRIREGCDCTASGILSNTAFILIHASARDATDTVTYKNLHVGILIHASARDATAKSYKISNNFAALFRKFIQKLGIVIFRISIFFRRVRTIFLFL